MDKSRLWLNSSITLDCCTRQEPEDPTSRVVVSNNLLYSFVVVRRICGRLYQNPNILS